MTERDPVTCWGDCNQDDPAELVSTPAGPLCRECAEDAAASEGWSI